MCKGNEGFRGEIERGNSVVLLATPDERQDEISKSALDSRLTDRSFARLMSFLCLHRRPYGGRASAHARLGRKGLSAIAISGRTDAHGEGGGGGVLGDSGFQVTGMIEGFLGFGIFDFVIMHAGKNELKSY